MARIQIVSPSVIRALPKGMSVAKLLAVVLGSKWLAMYDAMDPVTKHVLQYDWTFWARNAQIIPDGDWHTWVIMGGRGFGKTRPGSETVIQWAHELGEQHGRGHIALVGKDPGDIRKVMIEGAESGILACSPPWFRPKFEPSKNQLTWPNGVIATYYSSETPDDLRGPQHHKAWGDEPCKWKYAQDTWDQLQFGLRLGDNPQTVLTTTPRPIQMLIQILRDPKTVVTGGHTDENRENLSDVFIKEIHRKFDGTRLGRQELNAELLTDTPGALWKMDQIDNLRIKEEQCPEMETIVVAIDPAVTDPKDDPELMDKIAETGMVVVGKGVNGHGYVLDDLSDHMSPDTWGKKAIAHYETRKAERIVGEVNNGGDLIEYVIKTCAKDLGTEYVSYKKVHASRGKKTRAEPVAAIYEQKRFHHVGSFPELEDQMTTWMPGQKSPDRMDALVWGATEAMVLSPDELLFG